MSRFEVREIAARNAHEEGWKGRRWQGKNDTWAWKEERDASWRRKRRKEVETSGECGGNKQASVVEDVRLPSARKDARKAWLGGKANNK